MIFYCFEATPGLKASFCHSGILISTSTLPAAVAASRWSANGPSLPPCTKNVFDIMFVSPFWFLFSTTATRPLHYVFETQTFGCGNVAGEKYRACWRHPSSCALDCWFTNATKMIACDYFPHQIFENIFCERLYPWLWWCGCPAATAIARPSIRTNMFEHVL